LPGSRRLRGASKAPSQQQQNRLRQQRFCEEYVVDLHGENAAIRAGYSKRTARSQASALLTKPNIQAEVSRLAKVRALAVESTAEEVLRETRAISLTDIFDLVIRDEHGRVFLKKHEDMPKGAGRLIKKLKYKRKILEDSKGAPTGVIEEHFELELWDKMKALDLLGQYHQLWAEKEAIPSDPGDVLRDLADVIERADG
jgi:phage terminase small subunit